MHRRSAIAPPYRTKTELAYQALRDELMAGAYPPGARVVVDQFAARMGTSRIPVREAVLRLVAEGWLQISPHVGAFVPELSPDEVLETSVIRAAVEGAAVRAAAPHVSPAALEQLRALVQRLDTTPAAEYPRVNFEFHALTFAACPHPLLKSMAESALERTRRAPTVRFLPSYMADSQRQHRALLEAIERRDGEFAERIAKGHAEHSGNLLWEFAKEHASQVLTPSSGVRHRVDRADRAGGVATEDDRL
jgi:DNA-binding GntR family transcriptional regulator